MKIEVFGTGCPRCNATHELCERAVALLQVDAQVVKVRELRDIAMAGVTSLPTMRIDGKTVVSGHVPDFREIADAIMNATGH